MGVEDQLVKRVSVTLKSAVPIRVEGKDRGRVGASTSQEGGC